MSAAAIVVFTREGRLVPEVAWRRPGAPILALCPDEPVARSLSLRRAVIPVVLDWDDHSEDHAVDQSLHELVQRGHLQAGDTVVILSSFAPSNPSRGRATAHGGGLVGKDFRGADGEIQQRLGVKAKEEQARAQSSRAALAGAGQMIGSVLGSVSVTAVAPVNFADHRKVIVEGNHHPHDGDADGPRQERMGLGPGQGGLKQEEFAEKPNQRRHASDTMASVSTANHGERWWRLASTPISSSASASVITVMTVKAASTANK